MFLSYAKKFILRQARVAVRASLEEEPCKHNELTASFRHYDRDGSGELSMQEIYGILEEFGMLPRTKSEQQEIGHVIEELDRDGSNSFELMEFHDFFQMMMEQVRLSERKQEHELGVSLGISDEKFSLLRRTLREPFEELMSLNAKRSRRAEKRQPVKQTELCAFFAEGKCTRGNRCTFAHGIAQLRPRPDLYKTRLCSSYTLLKRCPYGASCTHAHGEEELRPIGDIPDPEVHGFSKEASSTASGDTDLELSLSSLVNQFGLPKTRESAPANKMKYADYNPATAAPYPVTTPDYDYSDYSDYTPWGSVPNLHQIQANAQAMQFLAASGEDLDVFGPSDGWNGASDGPGALHVGSSLVLLGGRRRFHLRQLIDSPLTDDDLRIYMRSVQTVPHLLSAAKWSGGITGLPGHFRARSHEVNPTWWNQKLCHVLAGEDLGPIRRR
ncbi:CTH1 [Symbiodinium natans]|uniref:CTH1 protein n=1 Tax=Symbiodinium natans TaxID=878477 RepID=A0A812U4M5_9DINO|nr:CTH1 [Symbiodinium natans]